MDESATGTPAPESAPPSLWEQVKDAFQLTRRRFNQAVIAGARLLGLPVPKPLIEEMPKSKPLLPAQRLVSYIEEHQARTYYSSYGKKGLMYQLRDRADDFVPLFSTVTPGAEIFEEAGIFYKKYLAPGLQEAKAIRDKIDSDPETRQLLSTILESKKRAEIKEIRSTLEIGKRHFPAKYFDDIRARAKPAEQWQLCHQEILDLYNPKMTDHELLRIFKDDKTGDKFYRLDYLLRIRELRAFDAISHFRDYLQQSFSIGSSSNDAAESVFSFTNYNHFLIPKRGRWRPSYHIDGSMTGHDYFSLDILSTDAPEYVRMLQGAAYEAHYEAAIRAGVAAMDKSEFMAEIQKHIQIPEPERTQEYTPEAEAQSETYKRRMELVEQLDQQLARIRARAEERKLR